MVRNLNPFTGRQTKFLQVIREKIRQISDPDPDIITHESYEFCIKNTKHFGKIPKLRFKPKSSQIKAEIVQKAGLVDENREAEIAEIRGKYGVQKARNGLAMLFESEWNNIMVKLKKSVFVAGYINQLFATEHQTLSEPTLLTQWIVKSEYAPQIGAKRKPIIQGQEAGRGEKSEDFKRYDEELAEVD